MTANIFSSTMNLLVQAFILLSSVFSGSNAAFSYSLENNLRTLIFTTNSYNRFTRPEVQVAVTAELNLLTLTSLSIKDQMMSVAGYFTLNWSDSRLNWTGDPTYSADIPAFYTTQDYVWVPSLSVTNSVSDIAVISDNTVVIRVAQDGSLHWTPGGVYNTQCTTDVTYYPFDSQTCSVTLATWGYTSIEISLRGSTVDTTYYEPNGEWEFSSHSISSSTRAFGSNSLPQISFHLKFKRRPYFQLMNTIIPMVLLASLSVFVFQLPPDSGEKMGYSLTTLLAFAVYLTLVSADIPTTSINTPCLSVYLIIMLSMGVTSVFLTIYILKCHHSPDDKPIPNYLKRFCELVGKISCICCKKKNVVDGQDIEEKVKAPVENKEPELTWQEVTKILDNFFFKLYAVILSLLTFSVLLALIINYSAA